MTIANLPAVTAEERAHRAAVYLFTPRPVEIQAPPGIALLAAMERHSARALREYEGIHSEALDQIRQIMGEATIMRMPDGSYYTRDLVHRTAQTIEPEDYFAITFHEGKR